MNPPGTSVEGITVPLGDPQALEQAATQLQDVAGRLNASSGQIMGLPSLMSSWAGPGSSAFASLTGQEATAMGSMASSVSLTSLSIRSSADTLAEAQRQAQRAIVRAERARERIDEALREIEEAEQAQDLARARMAAAALARQAAEARMVASVVDALAGDGSAAAAADAAAAEERDAERDLREAERRERKARTRLAEAREDLREARREGAEAAESAELNATGLQTTLAMLPSAVLAMPGAPAKGHVSAAGGIRTPVEREVPVSEREPPEHWPGFLKSWFKVGRGTATAIDGTVQLGRRAWEEPERVPGAVWGLGERALSDPVATTKTLIGYDELAAGRFEDWFGQMGIGLLTAGAATAPARASRLNRVAGSPRLQPVGAAPIRNGSKFAGGRMDFTRPDFGVRQGAAPDIPEPRRVALAEKYPNGVRFTRAGYPVLTPYAERRVAVEGMNGDYKHDAKLANERAGLDKTPLGRVWHHVEDGRHMELVPRDLHRDVGHTGGAAAIRNDQVGEVAPGGVLTPGERLAAGAGAAGGGAAANPATAQASP